MGILFFVVALAACTIGSICGMGGGVIMKPVFDAIGWYDVAAINFLSGCTVLGMSSWSVCKTLLKKESTIELKKSTYLAVGAAIGGVSGKYLYALAESSFSDPNKAGGVQAGILLAATFATFLYTVNKNKIKGKNIRNVTACFLIGFLLGNFGSFLGIGGGPFNVAVLYYFFSMNTKTAAQNSLYIIVFSQTMGILSIISGGSVLKFDMGILAGMIFFGIIGSELGRAINKRLSEKDVTRLFEISMVLIMLINIYNVVQLTK